LAIIDNIGTDDNSVIGIKRYLKENGIVWYLGMALSNDPLIRKIYTKSFSSRHNCSVWDCLMSGNISVRNKIAFFLHKLKLIKLYLLIKGIIEFSTSKNTKTEKANWFS